MRGLWTSLNNEPRLMRHALARPAIAWRSLRLLPSQLLSRLNKSSNTALVRAAIRRTDRARTPVFEVIAGPV
jgi:hypothetical protein